MAMNFHDSKNRTSYTGREADGSWERLIAEKVHLIGSKAADIGCGGGIYAKALARLGAAEVIGIDFSQAMLDGAAEHCAGWPAIRFGR